MTDSACQEKQPGLLFSDRAWGVKLLASLGLFALLMAGSDDSGPEGVLQVEHAVRPAQEIRGRRVQFWAHPVISCSQDEFAIDSEAGPIRIKGWAPLPQKGQVVSGVGTVLDQRLVQASVLRVNTEYRFKRGLTYGVSILTVLGYLWLVRRRFRFGPDEGALRSRY